MHGLYKVTSIDAVDFSFSFDVNPDEIIVFFTEDINDILLLYFYHDFEGQGITEVELQRKHWPFISIEFDCPVLYSWVDSSEITKVVLHKQG